MTRKYKVTAVGTGYVGMSMAALLGQHNEVVVYEPLPDDHFFNSEVTHELDGFKSRCDVIIANRMVNELKDISDKVFTEDLFGND